MTYLELTTQIANYCQQQNDPGGDFTAALPTFISNAELRIYRELDFAALSAQSIPGQIMMTAGDRLVNLGMGSPPLIAGPGGDTLVLPWLENHFFLGNTYVWNGPSCYFTVNGGTSGGVGPTGLTPPLDGNITWVFIAPIFVSPLVVESISAVIPAGDAPSAGTRIPMLLSTVDAINMFWPKSSVTSVPGTPFAYYAMLDYQTAMVAPTPDAAYQIEVTGTWRAMPMTPGNPTTYLSTWLPDLLFIACMVEATGWMQNFGQQSDNPQMALSWEARYQQQKDGANGEEQWKKGQGPGWQPFSPTPQSGSPRN